MSELNFLAFCITVIVVTAIVFGKDDVAMKAISILGSTTKNFLSAIRELSKQSPLVNKNFHKSIDEKDEV